MRTDGSTRPKLCRADVRCVGSTRSTTQTSRRLPLKRKLYHDFLHASLVGSWSSLLLGLQQDRQDLVLEAVEVLETKSHMQEETFAWKAAEMAVEAGDDVPVHVALSAVADVVANLPIRRAAKSCVSLVPM